MVKSIKYKAISTFSGAMGLDLGLERAGIDVRVALDNDAKVCATIKRNRPNLSVLSKDIRNYSSDEILKAASLKKENVFLMGGGPPCQAFSSAGKRRGLSDERGNVFIKYIELISEINPKYYIIENVRGLLSCPLNHVPHGERDSNYTPGTLEARGGALMYIMKMLQDIGYSCTFTLYNSALFGVPQARERVVILGARSGEEIPFLRPTHTLCTDGSNGLKPALTFSQAVEGIEEGKCRHARFPEKRLKYYRMLKAGQNWRNLPKASQMEALGNSYYSGGGKTGFLRRIAWDAPSPTLVTSPTMPATDLAHPSEDRPLSVEEYKRVQQFPDEWVFEGSLVDMYRQIGNAVPLGLGEAIGRHIIEFDAMTTPQRRKALSSQNHLRLSRYKNTSHEYFRQLMESDRQLSLI